MRINPRRPSKTTPAGLKRIVLAAPSTIETRDQPKPLRTVKNPNKTFLAIAHSNKGVLDDHARQTIAAAAILADADMEIVALILGELNEDIADTGADKVLVLPELDVEQFQPDIELACITAQIASIQPARIFMPDNFIDGDLGRRLIASEPQKTAATQVVEIDASHVAIALAGNSLLVQNHLPEIILLAKDAADTHLPFTGLAQSIAPTISDLAPNQQYHDLGMQSIAATEIALEEADFIVSAGNGVQNVTTFETLAHALQASIGASRVAVDDGKFARDKQVGATGKTVSASAYVAIGISGAVQHLQGIKDCRHVIVINRDNSAPIVKRADLSVIGDAEEIMQALIALINQAKNVRLEKNVQEAA
jgi:electron transfer flavoprotein alpha subunit